MSRRHSGILHTRWSRRDSGKRGSDEPSIGQLARQSTAHEAQANCLTNKDYPTRTTPHRRRTEKNFWDQSKRNDSAKAVSIASQGEHDASSADACGERPQKITRFQYIALGRPRNAIEACVWPSSAVERSETERLALALTDIEFRDLGQESRDERPGPCRQRLPANAAVQHSGVHV